ncbi:MAG: hypothetical protein IK077_01855, partial [Thermoguttaceae bacterium]|nr:hypothetical protein [Thermoguttaceae bacterium]
MENEKTLTGNGAILDFSSLNNSPLNEDEKRRLNPYLSPLSWAPHEIERMLDKEYGYLFELYREPIIQRAILIVAESVDSKRLYPSQYKDAREWLELCGFVVKFVDLFNVYREERERGGKTEGIDLYPYKWTEQIVFLESHFERVDAYFQRFLKQYPQEDLEALTRERNTFEYDMKRYRTIIDNKKRSCARKRGGSAMTLDVDLLNGFVKKLIAKEVINYYLEDKTRR